MSRDDLNHIKLGIDLYQTEYTPIWTNICKLYSWTPSTGYHQSIPTKMTTKINKGSHETCHDSLPYFYITQDGARGAIYDKVSYIDGLAQDCGKR